MMQLMMTTWFVSSAALALGVAVACDKIFGTFATGPRLASARSRRSSGRRPLESARREKEETRACRDIGPGDGRLLCPQRRLRRRLRPADGHGEGRPMIENIILTVVSLAILVYLFVALVRPEVF